MDRHVDEEKLCHAKHISNIFELNSKA